ncbi:MAG: TetR/AcrR family transcriptional regulator [Armatimonadota bacterium]
MSRSAELSQKMRDERRERILFHALRLFAARGLAATKISDIATASGMSQGLLYHYFRAKEDIFVELIRGAFERMNSAARALEDLPLPPREKIRLALVQLLRGIEDSEEFACTVLLNAQAGISDVTPAEAQAILRAESGIPYAVVTRLMQAGQRDGSVKQHDAEELSLLFWTAIKGLALHKAVYGAAYKSPDVRILASMFFTEELTGGLSHFAPRLRPCFLSGAMGSNERNHGGLP